MKIKTPTANTSTRFSLRLAPVLLIAVLLLLGLRQTQANTIALSFASHSNEVDQSNITFGWAFSLSNSIQVTDLGFWDSNNGDGLGESHIITIWTSSGIQVAQGIVPAGTAGSLIDGFRYVSLLSSVMLGAGDYVIGGYSQNSSDSYAYAASGITTAAGVTYTGDRQGNGNAMPTLSGGSNGMFGPNFQFGSGSIASVPEASSTWRLLLFAAAVVAGSNLLLRKPA